jgi:hypothetical protein
MSILPEGLSFREVKEPLKLRLVKSESAGPWFTVFINRLGVEDFRRLTSRMKRPAGVREGSKAEREYEAKFTEALVEKAIAGWEGCTPSNLQALLPPKFKIEDSEDRPEGFEIPFSHELAVWIHNHAFGDQWSERVMSALREGSEEDLDEEEETKE